MSWDGIRSLIDSAQRGDPEAATRLYALAQPYLLTVAQKLLGAGWPHKSSSDLTQETWLRAWQAIRDFRGAATDADTAALFRAWLARTMRNARLNDVRFDAAKCRRHPDGIVPLADGAAGDSTPAADPPGRDPSPSFNLHAEEQLRMLEAAIRKLPNPGDEEIVRLRFFQGLSYTEIGTRLRRDESTIRYRVQRILQFLGAELTELA
jgi:RNA polymerase sigma factor (sigma-70 family)